MSTRSLANMTPEEFLAEVDRRSVAPLPDGDEEYLAELTRKLFKAGLTAKDVLGKGASDRWYELREEFAEEYQSDLRSFWSIVTRKMEIERRWDVWTGLAPAELKRRAEVLKLREERIMASEQAAQAEYRDAFARQMQSRPVIDGLTSTIRWQAEQLGMTEKQRRTKLMGRFMALLKFKVHGAKHPFISEAELYKRLGKDDARTLLSLINQLGRELNVTEDLLR